MKELLTSGAGRTAAAAVCLLAIVTVAGLALLWPNEPGSVAAAPDLSGESLVAEVTKIAGVACDAPGAEMCQRVSARLISGPTPGATATFGLGNAVTSVRVAIGDRVRLIENELDPSAPNTLEPYSFLDYERRAPLIWLAVLFGVVVLLFGRLRGARSILGLAISVGIVFAFIVPAMLAGEPAVPVAAFGASAVMLVTIALAHGLGAKSIAAILGTTVSLALTIGLATLFSQLAYFTGLNSDDNAFILVGASDVSLRGVVIAGIVIGALGVLDDVTVSQSSTVMALRRANPTVRFRELFRQALDVGHDHVAATVNTLVLAYVGASLPILLIFSVGGAEIGEAVNSEAVAEQIVGMLVGSIGLITAVPITTALAALLATRLPGSAIADDHPGHSH